MPRAIKTIAGLQRVIDANNKRLSRFYDQDYVLAPALARNLARFDELNRIEDPSERFAQFRLIPALEYDLDAVDVGLTPSQRTSFAQQARARHPRTRLNRNGLTIMSLIREVVLKPQNPKNFKAKQYWKPFLESLARHDLNPKVRSDLVRPWIECVEYDACGSRRRLGRRQFENIVSKIRRALLRLN
jgi:hypothetical protein